MTYAANAAFILICVAKRTNQTRNAETTFIVELYSGPRTEYVGQVVNTIYDPTTRVYGIKWFINEKHHLSWV
jgi:hypothetical protein